MWNYVFIKKWKFLGWLLLHRKYCSSFFFPYVINSLIDISKWIYVCMLVCTLKQKEKDLKKSYLLCTYVCLSMMIDLRSIQSMYDKTCRRVYWYSPWDTLYLGIDTHHIDKDKKRCNRDGQPLSPCSFLELKEIKGTDIDLSSSVIRRRWFPPWDWMPCLIYINQLSLFHYPKRLNA